MPTLVLPLAGRIAEARKVRASNFLFGIGRGSAAWDAQWLSPNPPSARLEDTDLVSTIGYARPSQIDYLQEDANGSILLPGGLKMSVAALPTRYVRVRMNLPQGSFAGETVREIGLFIDAATAAGVPAGQVVLTPVQISVRGDLYQIQRREPFPVTEGDFLSANFIVRL